MTNVSGSRPMASRSALWLLMLFGSLFALSAQAQQTSNILRGIPVVQQTAAGQFTGRLSVNWLRLNKAGDLVANGVLSGSLAGQPVRQVFQNVVVDLAAGGDPRVCDILFLDIGPIFIDLLGLQINLSRIILDIEAVAGSGNLLGNLLCAIVGLLDNFTLDAVLRDIIGDILGTVNGLLRL